jgi:DNA repair exonuclease SbcCD ATPase subunit
VKWKNFLSTGNTFIEIQLDKNPTTLIIGENGSGKSTILDAMCFVMFGKPFRTVNKSQLVNSINTRETEVEIEFNVGTKEYRIMRAIKPNKFEIYCNGKMVNQDANVRDYQKYLEQNILKLNYRSFTQVVILGSSTFIPFMQLKARHRREVVEEILDIQIFSLMNMLLKQNLKTIEDEIKDIEYQVQLTSEKIGLQENYIDDVKKNKNKIVREKTLQIKNNIAEVETKTKEKETLLKTNADLLDSIDDKVKIKDKLAKLKDIRSTLTEKHKHHSRMVTFFENNNDCPTCEQHINEIFKEEVLTIKTATAKELKTGLGKLQDELNNTNNRFTEITDITSAIRSNEVKIATLGSSVDEIEKFNVKLDTEINIMNASDVSDTDLEKLEGLKENSRTIVKQRVKLKEDKVYAEASRAMLQDTGIKTKIIKQYLPIMNKLINTYLTSMEFYVNFTLDENFNETIKSRFRDEFTYASFSEGEKMRIDLALLFTWRAIAKMKNSTNTNLLVLDEIFDSSLDGTGTDEFLKILNTLAKENIFVISHKGDTLYDKFGSVIKFEKVKNFSHVVT